MRKKAILCLADGSTYAGTMFGACRDVMGELVFHTGASGYQGIISDPAYYGQIVMLTYPLIGNNGVTIEKNDAPALALNGLVVQELYEGNSEHVQSLEAYFEEHGLTGLCDVDTRAIARKIREKGVMNAAITEGEVTVELISKIRTYKCARPVDIATCKEAYEIPGSGEKIAVVDLGSGQALIRTLAALNCSLKVYPAGTPAEEILSDGCSGVVITNGPGDPEAAGALVDAVKTLMESRSVLGICLGHEIMALSQGGKIKKMPVGHRGGNHPVKDMETGKILITSQNHGYVVDGDTVPNNAEICCLSMNDGTVEGLRYENAMSFQFLPELQPDPREGKALLCQFLSMVERRN